MNYFAIQQSEHCNLFCDSLLRRYHQQLNDSQGRMNHERHFYDDDSDLHPDSSVLIGDHLHRCIELLAYVLGPLFRHSLGQGNYYDNMARIGAGLPR